MTEQNTDTGMEGQHLDAVAVRMGLGAQTLAVQAGYTVPLDVVVPLDTDRYRCDDGKARFEINVVINGVLLAQVMISAGVSGPATVSVFDADDLETAPICPTCDAGDPTNPFACECEGASS